MEKRKLFAVTAAATLAALLITETTNAQRCCLGLFRCGASRARFFQRTGARYYAAIPTTSAHFTTSYGVSNCSIEVDTTGVDIISRRRTPGPCAATSTTCEGGTCSTGAATSTAEVFAPGSICAGGVCFLDPPAPPTTTPTPCEPVETTTPEPCEPVKCAAEYAPIPVDEFLTIVNETRAAYRLPALTCDARLKSEATDRVRICAYFGDLRHGVGGEVLAMNTGGGIRTAVNQWLNSPGHRALLLNAGYRYAGAAKITDANGRTFYAVRFR